MTTSNSIDDSFVTELGNDLKKLTSISDPEKRSSKLNEIKIKINKRLSSAVPQDHDHVQEFNDLASKAFNFTLYTSIIIIAFGFLFLAYTFYYVVTQDKLDENLTWLLTLGGSAGAFLTGFFYNPQRKVKNASLALLDFDIRHGMFRTINKQINHPTTGSSFEICSYVDNVLKILNFKEEKQSPKSGS